MRHFVEPGSIVRRIWGRSDTILLVFGGAAAEFALNRAVDWLFFTGAIPRDPIGRLFSTAAFAREIAFGSREEAEATLARIRGAHAAVERARGGTIPDWAHRDVLYMLIAYSERAQELLERPLTGPEREELYAVFRRIGEGLGVRELPASYAEWRADRIRHLERDLAVSSFTHKLYAAYRRHLGPLRYAMLLEVQALLVPPMVRRLLGLRGSRGGSLGVGVYRGLRRAGLGPLAQRVLVPPRYWADLGRLEQRDADAA
ncbi:MAG TPA: oxygenase MpaB family protein [Gemmatimonadales bacterium]|nr:oxygenase MpaB family protein [Gemmatimonadales bacterium]